MLCNTHIQKLSAFTLCLLYSLCLAAMALCCCSCKNVTRQTLASQHTTCSCAKNCCAAKAEKDCCTPNNGETMLGKAHCGMANMKLLKAEHQAEQPKTHALSFGTLLLLVILPNQQFSIDKLASAGVLADSYVLPPKVPLIYKIACLRL